VKILKLIQKPINRLVINNGRRTERTNKEKEVLTKRKKLKRNRLEKNLI